MYQCSKGYDLVVNGIMGIMVLKKEAIIRSFCDFVKVKQKYKMYTPHNDARDH